VPGWNREEMRNHGTDPRKRMKVLHHWLPFGPRSTIERALDQRENAIGRFIGG
jgi:hypothetical protein